MDIEVVAAAPGDGPLYMAHDDVDFGVTTMMGTGEVCLGIDFKHEGISVMFNQQLVAKLLDHLDRNRSRYGF